jgi:NAD(P)-dependent dehydrogenase (short-subunit alcohol dehydrogenase family)
MPLPKQGERDMAATDPFDLTGRAFIVTAGTKGIGSGIVGQLLLRGANVVFTARRQESCDENGALLNAAYGGRGGSAVGIPLRMDDIEGQGRVIEFALEQFGRLDGFVSNAAYTGTHMGGSADMPEEDAIKILRVNIFGNLRFCHAVAPHIGRQGGAIVLISSIAGRSAAPPTLVYGASKAGVEVMAKSLAAEFAPLGVRVNCVAPGLIRSPSSGQVWKDPDKLAKVERGIPLGRIGEPDDIGAACAFLLSDGGSYVTAQSIVVDGGRLGTAPSTAHGMSGS